MHHQVATLVFQETIKRICMVRADNWGEEVKHRLEHCIDLVAAKAKYHGNCKAIFFSKKDCPRVSDKVETTN